MIKAIDINTIFKVTELRLSLESYNRYNNKLLLEYDGELYQESSPIPIIEKGSKDMYYTVSEETAGRIDLIAEKFYNNAKLGWAVCFSNDLFDSFNELIVGKVLRIPDIASIYNVL